CNKTIDEFINEHGISECQSMFMSLICIKYDNSNYNQLNVFKKNNVYIQRLSKQYLEQLLQYSSNANMHNIDNRLLVIIPYSLQHLYNKQIEFVNTIFGTSSIFGLYLFLSRIIRPVWDYPIVYINLNNECK